MKRILIIFLLLCITLPTLARNDRKHLDVRIFQTLDEQSALASSENLDVVKIITGGEVYYDGKHVSGRFQFMETYTYITKENVSKTVPVYQKVDELEGYADYSQDKMPVKLSIRIFQTLSENEALAKTEDGMVVKVETLSDTYYDGNTFKGKYILAGTYSYTNRDNEVKTVPVYIKEKEYRELNKKLEGK